MSDVITDTFVEAVLLPILDELHQETGQQLHLAVLLSGVGDQPVRRTVESAPSRKGQDAAEGDIRVLLQLSSDAGVARFEAEAVIKGLSPGSGFSGFSLRGKIDLGAQPPKARLFAKTNRYNVWSWGRKFRSA